MNFSLIWKIFNLQLSIIELFWINYNIIFIYLITSKNVKKYNLKLEDFQGPFHSLLNYCQWNFDSYKNIKY